MVDWNEDGLKDLIVGENDGKVRYYRNIGTIGNPLLTFQGYLQCAGQAIDCGDYSFPYVNDWNEDGMKDLLVGDSDGLVYLFINVGTNAAPVFQTQQNVYYAGGGLIDFDYRSGPVVKDIDNDGLKDLISGAMDGYVYWCKNNGTNANPQLAMRAQLLMGSVPISTMGTSRIDVFDWNQDGDLDLLVGNYDSRVQLYLQTDITSPAPTITLVRTSPVMIPTNGGTVSYNIAANNNTTSQVTFDCWTEAQLPNGNLTQPIIFKEDLTLPPSGHMGRSIDQNVPGSAPNGIYYYYGYLGDYETMQIYSSSSFYFYKYDLDGFNPGNVVNNWETSGWGEDVDQIASASPEIFELLTAYPNPFNPHTNLSFTLPEEGRVSLAIFDIEGRQVASLVNGFYSAGQYDIQFDASDLTSGVYFAQLTSGNSVSTQKLMLIK